MVEIEGEAIFAVCIAAPFLSADRRLTSLRLLKGQCVVFMYISFHFISLILSDARIACLNSGKCLTKEQYKRWNSNDSHIKERPQTSRRCRYINADVLSGGSTGRTHCIWRTNMKSQGWLTLQSLFEVIFIGHCATKLFSVKPPHKEQHQQCLKNEVDVVCCFHGGLLNANNGPNSATQIVQRGIFYLLVNYMRQYEVVVVHVWCCLIMVSITSSSSIDYGRSGCEFMWSSHL